MMGGSKTTKLILLDSLLQEMLILLPGLVVGVVCADSLSPLPVPDKGVLLDDGGRDGKSFGLHTSLDGGALIWANTSAVTTAGFFGNAAILLAGVYLLTHTDEMESLRDSLLPLGKAKAKVQTGVEEEQVNEEENMFEKGQNLIGETFSTLTNNMNKVSQGLSKRKGGLFKLPSLENLMPTKLENPLIKLKEKLFPTESEDKVITLAEKPTATENPEDIFVQSFAEKLAMESWYDMINKEHLEEDSWTFNINKNADFEHYEDQDQDQHLPFLYDSVSSYPTFQQHASTSKENIVMENIVPDMRESLHPPAQKEVPQEEKKSLSEEKAKLAEHKARLQEKKRKWAESFLEHFYKKQELEKQTKEQLQQVLPVEELPSDGGMVEYDLYEGEELYDNHGFYEEGYSRIGDDEVRAIIEAQFPDFETFGVKIPKTADLLEKDSMEDMIEVSDLSEVEGNDENIEITTSSYEETTAVIEEETTIQTQYNDELMEYSDDEEDTSKDILASKGDDVLIDEEGVEKPLKKMKKVKKMKKKEK